MYKGIDQFPLGSSDPGCLKFLNWRTFQEKKSPEMINFFLYCIKKMSFSSSPKVTPTTGVVELWFLKNAMKTNGIRLYSTKNGWTFPWFSWSFTVGVKIYSFWCPPKWLISFHSYLKNDFFKLTEGYPHDRCRRTMKKKLVCHENQWNWVVFLFKKSESSPWDLYSMYVVLQGIGSLPCIRV